MASVKNNKTANHRDRILKANSTVFVAVAVAAVVVSFALVSVRFLWERKSYNERVISAKTEARDILNSNLTNMDSLKEQFGQLEKSSSLNSTTILHALPPTYDYAALASSIESLAQRADVSFVGSPGQDNSADSALNAYTSTPVEIPLTLQVSGDYDGITTFIKALELSIRPISVDSVVYSGSNSTLQANIQATTYYQPSRNLGVSKKEIQ